MNHAAGTSRATRRSTLFSKPQTSCCPKAVYHQHRWACSRKSCTNWSPQQEMEKYFPNDVLEPGTHGDIPGTTDRQMTEKDWRDQIASSHRMIPESIARTIEEASAAKKDWKEELARFIHGTCKSDSRTWTKQSRRVAGLPGWSREIESNIVIVLDTSGSVTGSILAAFAAECRAITALNGLTAVIMSADARVHQTIMPGEPFPTTWKGGGGTSFVPALKAAEKYEPNCVVYLNTTVQGTYPKSSLYPVLWADTTLHGSVWREDSTGRDYRMIDLPLAFYLYLRYLVCVPPLYVELAFIRTKEMWWALHEKCVGFRISRLHRRLTKLGYKIVDDEVVPL